MQTIDESVISLLREAVLTRRRGKIVSIQGLLIEVTGLDVCLGEIVKVTPRIKGSGELLAEVIALKNEKALLMPHDSLDGLSLEDDVIATGRVWSIAVGEGLLGRVLDATGKPLDDIPLTGLSTYVKRHSLPINPLMRMSIKDQLRTGVKVIDLFTPLGKGQRIGIFAGSGVGKSTLLGMICRQTDADVVVLALIGERGREVTDFINENLTKDRRKKTVVIAASADQSAVKRKQAAYTATCIAEWFRDQGKNVLLVMDSVTRLVMAQREIALAAGEPVGARGFPASSLALLPPLLERAGSILGKGSITGIYTVLVEGDDMNEPVADHMRAILDGHIVLSRSLADKNHYPPIDVLKSVSRLSGVLWSPLQKKLCSAIKNDIATYESQSDFIELGAYQKGANPELDRIISIRSDLNKLLTQYPDELMSPEELDFLIDGFMKKMSMSSI